MQITFIQFVRILAKHLIRKTYGTAPEENMLSSVALSLKSSIERGYADKLRELNILTDTMVNVDVLEDKFKSFFETFPVYRMKFLQGTVEFTWKDALLFINDCKALASVESKKTPDVIYLPYAA